MESDTPALIDLRNIPATPGVYIMKDASGRVLYVGKAKHLRRRVASYFRTPSPESGPAGRVDQSPKTRALMAKVKSLDTLCTATEKEALLLEASLIKKHRPRYNIVLRDDKQYILFRLDKHSEYPRLSLTRRVTRDGSVYFGPFTSALAAREAWKAIHRIFPLRRCKDGVFRNRVRPCLYHQMGQCLAPCVLPVPIAEYAELVRKVELLFSGRSGELLAALKTEMLTASQDLDFEAAARFRDQIRAVEQTLERQAAVLPGEEDLDVLGLAETKAGLGLGLLFVRRGRLLDAKSFFWPGLGLESGPEALTGFLSQYYGPGRYVPERILVPWDPSAMDAQEPADEGEAYSALELQAQILAELRGGPVRIAAPKNAMEKKLTAMAATNAKEHAARTRETSFLDAIARKLHLPGPPRRIEAVDVSHTLGEETRAGLVVFEDAAPRKEDYRVYAFTEGGGDDYAVLAAWAGRRFDSGPPWPDLLLVDGGKGQLAAVVAALTAKAGDLPFAVASIAKAREAIESRGAAFSEAGEGLAPSGTRRRPHAMGDLIYLPGRKNHVDFATGSTELLFLQHVRDTVHNFVISRHRKGRRKAVLAGELLRLEGVGPKTARLLWDHFASVEAMAKATPEELAAVPGLGAKKAMALHEQLRALKRGKGE